MKSLKEMKQKGRVLRQHLETVFGAPVSLSQAYEALAVSEGFANWNVLSEQLANSVAGPADIVPVVVKAQARIANASPIRAVFRTVDGSASVEFDASDFFNEAALPVDIEELLALEGEHIVGLGAAYGKTPLADYIAQFCARTVPEVQAVYDYIAALRKAGGDCGGSDCFVSQDDVKAWLSKSFSYGPTRLRERSHNEAYGRLVMGQFPEAEGEVLVPHPAENLYNMLQIMEVNLVDVLNEYDVPEDALEWQWVESQHSFKHRDNGAEPGVWEFIVRVEKMNNEDFAETTPATLLPFFKAAKKQGVAWIMFHQG